MLVDEEIGDGEEGGEADLEREEAVDGEDGEDGEGEDDTDRIDEQSMEERATGAVGAEENISIEHNKKSHKLAGVSSIITVMQVSPPF